MHYYVTSSKRYHAIALPILAGFAWVVYLVHSQMPIFVGVVSACLIGLGFLGVIYGLCSSSIIVSVDEFGIAYYPRLYPRFEWSDVVEAQLLPARMEMSDGSISLRTENKRIVMVTVRNADAKYTSRMSRFARMGVSGMDGASGLRPLIRPEAPELLRFPIDLYALTGDAHELCDCITWHLTNTKPKMRTEASHT